MKALVRFFVDRDLLINLISVVVILLGLYSAFTMNRETFPNVDLDQIQVSVLYPGASPEELERLVITPIEQELKALSGIDDMISSAYPGSAMITLLLEPNASNRSRIASDVQLAINRADLPRDLPYDPLVLEIDTAMMPVIQLAISADRSELELKRLGDNIIDDLLALKGVGGVTLQGPRRAEIRINLKPEKLQQYRVSIQEIVGVLQNWNVNAPGGEFDTRDGQKVIRIVGEFTSTDDVADLVLRANEAGDTLRLGDVADISEDLEKATRVYDVSGQKALSMMVRKKADGDIISTVEKVYEYIETIPDRYGVDVNVEPFQDMSKLAKMRLGVLTNNAGVGVFLVFITLLLFLRLSVALTTTLGLPVVFLSGLYLLDISGVTLNMISMMGFIMVLGMLVDDAIIIGENITYHMEKGMKPHEAAVQGAVELMGPVTATVLTTIVAFGPMLFVSGMMGKFIIAIPIVVMLLLALSWFESFFILPSHVAFFTKADLHPPERRWLVWVEEKYGDMLEWVIKWRKTTVAISVAVFFGSIILAATAMRFELFPPVAVDTITMDVTAKPGTSLQTMRSNLKAVDAQLRSLIDDANLENTILGSGRIINDQDGSRKEGPRYGQIRLLYKPAVSRPDHDAVEDMRLLEKALPLSFPDLAFVFKEVRPGPPTGRPLEVELSGNNLNSVIKVAEQLENYLHGIDGVTSIESGLDTGDPEIHVVLDRQLATYAGVNLNVAATHVRAAIDGLRATSIRRGTEEVDVTIRLPHNGDSLDEVLGKIQLPNNRGGLVNLAEVARFEEHSGFSSVRHKDGIRVITVIGNIDSKIITSAELNAQVNKNKSQWMGEYDKDVNAKYGGEAEANVDSMRDLMASFLFAIIGIFFILAIQFNNFRYPIVVMMAIPYGTIGIIVSFYLHDLLWKPMPLSFFTVLGMVALTGVVVNSSLILLAFIQRAREEGMEWHDAIINAGKRRLRAVLLTATTTIFGLLPTAYGWGGEDPVVAPMALALAWGLIFGTVITLIVIPAITAVGINAKVTLNGKVKPFIRANTIGRLPWFKT